VAQLIQRKDLKSLDEALDLLQTTMFYFSMKLCAGSGKTPKTPCRGPVQVVSTSVQIRQPRDLHLFQVLSSWLPSRSDTGGAYPGFYLPRSWRYIFVPVRIYEPLSKDGDFFERGA
jgi:hypothetical protein